MKKYILLFVAILAFAPVTMAQKNGKPKKISAKKARKEALAAKEDAVFQDMMNEGHTYFSENEFEKAIEKYESAANRRPINVYPRVKIADVQLAMLNYVEEPEESVAIVVPEPDPEPPTKKTTPEERVAAAYEQEEQKIKKDVPPPPPPPKDEPIIIKNPKVKTQVSAGDVKKMTPDEFALSLGEKYPDGVTEETYTEGSKTITRRIVVKNGRGTDYRMVAGKHKTYYFKNDKSITKFNWDTETKK